MRKSRLRRTAALLLGSVALSATLPSAAHHSFAAYEPTKTVTLNGTLKTLQWSNPHVAFRVLVQGEGRSEAQQWTIVTSSPNILAQFGWNRNSIKPGERISVLCNPLNDGSPGGRLHTVVKLDTGETLKTKLSASIEPEHE